MTDTKANKFNRGIGTFQGKWTSTVINQLAYNRYFNELSEILMNRFKWIGLPLSVDKRFLEWELFYHGISSLFIDSNTGILLTGQTNTIDEPDLNYNYSQFKVIGPNGYNQNCSMLIDKVIEGISPGVIIWDNTNRISNLSTVQYFAKKLADLDRTIDVQADKQKNPTVLEAPAEQKNTILNMWKQKEDNVPVIMKSDGISTTSSQLFDPALPYTGLEIQATKDAIYREFDIWAGIQAEPLEHVNVAEAQKILERQELRRLNFIEQRRRACELINAMLGTNIGVVWNRDNESMLYDISTNIGKMDEFGLLDAVTGETNQTGEDNNAVNNNKIKPGSAE